MNISPDMNSSLNRLVLGILLIWNTVRAVWMSYAVLSGLQMLASGRGLQPYFGIGFDRQSLFLIGAMPLDLSSIIAGFLFGRPGQVVVQIIAAAAYGLAAIGIWPYRKRIRLIAIALGILESLLLAWYLTYAIPTKLLAEYHRFAIISWLAFLCIYVLTSVFLVRLNGKGSLGREMATIGNSERAG